MKISKLFHWLYAFLMFLPVLALAPSMFYFAFNEHATDYVDVQVNETYEYETNEVNSVDDLVEGNIYKLETTANEINNTLPQADITYASYIRVLLNNNNDEYKYNAYGNKILFNNGSANINFFLLDSNNTTIFSFRPVKTNITGEFICYFVYLSGFNNNYINYISASDYLGEKNVEVVRSEQSPMNIFYTAVNYVYDMPVFSWAKTSFLALPVTYITGLFGMAQTNVVNYYLSYWLAISIVYLVFDLVMYVPLLVHRWIDKGMLE